MAGQARGKGAEKDMEYLIKLLHKEWETSGSTVAEISVSFEDVATVEKRLAEAIIKKQGQLEIGQLTFRQSMEFSKDNFILLRIVKKVMKAEKKNMIKKAGLGYAIELDREEYTLFSKIIGIQEV